jgi:uncharacterized protein (DUF58 family)
LRKALTPRWVAITGMGLAVLGACLAVGGMAIFFTNNLFYLLVAMLLGFVSVSGVLSELTVRGLALRRNVPEDVFARSPVLITVELTNLKRRFPSFCLNVKDEQRGGETFLLHVAAGRIGRQRYETRFPVRGPAVLGEATVSTTFPFGFFRKRASFKESAPFLVLPQVQDLTTVLRSQAVGSGDFHRAHKGEGTNLFGIREYRWGDSSRLIHWKSTARMTEVMIKELEREVSGSVTVELAGGFTDRLETAVSLAASLALYLESRQIRFRLRTGAGATPFDTGKRHLRGVLRSLALYQNQRIEEFALLRKEEHVLCLVPEEREVPPGRQAFPVGPEWDWLLLDEAPAWQELV